jgi:hypothetical protein
LRTVFRWLARDVIEPSSVAELRAFFKVRFDGGFTKEEYERVTLENSRYIEDDDDDDDNDDNDDDDNDVLVATSPSEVDAMAA